MIVMFHYNLLSTILQVMENVINVALVKKINRENKLFTMFPPPTTTLLSNSGMITYQIFLSHEVYQDPTYLPGWVVLRNFLDARVCGVVLVVLLIIKYKNKKKIITKINWELEIFFNIGKEGINK